MVLIQPATASRPAFRKSARRRATARQSHNPSRILPRATPPPHPRPAAEASRSLRWSFCGSGPPPSAGRQCAWRCYYDLRQHAVGLGARARSGASLALQPGEREFVAAPGVIAALPLRASSAPPRERSNRSRLQTPERAPLEARSQGPRADVDVGETEGETASGTSDGLRRIGPVGSSRCLRPLCRSC